jgi:ABC-type transport system involved in cytochrome bd biosynthesis fused ATPase/permease subunit
MTDSTKAQHVQFNLHNHATCSMYCNLILLSCAARIQAAKEEKAKEKAAKVAAAKIRKQELAAKTAAGPSKKKQDKQAASEAKQVSSWSTLWAAEFITLLCVHPASWWLLHAY